MHCWKGMLYKAVLLPQVRLFFSWNSNIKQLVPLANLHSRSSVVLSLNSHGTCRLNTRGVTKCSCMQDNQVASIKFQSCYYSTSFLEKMKKQVHKLGVILPSKYTAKQMENAAYVLLNSLYMKVEHGKLREYGGLEDSFNMWLIVVYLHVWFLFVRLKQEGRDGEILMSSIASMLWLDVEDRLKKYENELQQNIKVNEKMKDNWNAIKLLFAYLDEGVLGTDAQLASSLWSIMYSSNTHEAEAWHMEAMVHYIRFAIARIDGLPMETIVLRPESINWPMPEEFT